MFLTRSVLSHEQRAEVVRFSVGRRGAYCLLIILVGLLTASCTRNPNVDESLVDRSFLTRQPCAPPCWYGLELDKSSAADVHATLKQLPFVDQATIKEWETGWLTDENARGISWGCLHPSQSHDRCGGARLSQDRLKSLWLEVGYDLTFAAIVDELGLPDYVDYGPYHPDIGGCQIELYWPKKGITIESLDTRRDARCQAIKQSKGIEAKTKSSTIFYSVKEGFGSKPGGCCVRIPWPGFAKP